MPDIITFSSIKSAFFKNPPALSEVEKQAENLKYSYVADHETLFVQEAEHAYAALMGNEFNKSHFIHCYYACLALKAYYQVENYDDPSLHDYYSAKATALKTAIENQSGLTTPKERPSDLKISYEQFLYKKISTDAQNLARIPFHANQARAALKLNNLYRLNLVFSRLTVKQSLIMANQLQWLAQLEKWLHLPLNADKMVGKINAPTPIFNVLSVGIFFLLLVNEFALFAKHVAKIKSIKEHDPEASEWAQIKQEWHKRYYRLCNDLTWMCVNGFSNFAYLFHIPSPVANWVTSSFLVYDVLLLAYTLYVTHEDYLLKKSQYEQDIAALSPEHKAITEKQLQLLEIDWQTNKAILNFNMAAAGFLAVGFSAALLLTGPAIAATCYLGCTVAAGMYLSGDSFGTYYKKTLVAANAPTSLACKADITTAWDNFVTTITKNTLVPLALVAIYAVSLPAALLLTALYLGYENGYFSQPDSQMSLTPA